MKVKICGITDMETAKRACEYGADALGFVFAESKRKITPRLAKEIIQELPANVLKIGVFVNESVEVIYHINRLGNFYAPIKCYKKILQNLTPGK